MPNTHVPATTAPSRAATTVAATATSRVNIYDLNSSERVNSFVLVSGEFHEKIQGNFDPRRAVGFDRALRRDQIQVPVGVEIISIDFSKFSWRQEQNYPHSRGGFKYMATSEYLMHANGVIETRVEIYHFFIESLPKNYFSHEHSIFNLTCFVKHRFNPLPSKIVLGSEQIGSDWRQSPHWSPCRKRRSRNSLVS